MPNLDDAFARVQKIQDLPETPSFELSRAYGLITDGDTAPAWYVIFKWTDNFVMSRSSDLIDALNKACDKAEKELIDA